MAPELMAASARSWSHAGGDVGVLVLHGYTGNPTSMRPVAEALAAHGHSVELPRLPGHGTNPRDLARTTAADWAAAADAALDRLLGRCRAVVALGQSAGGALALDLVQRRADDVAALVLVNPWLRLRHVLRPLAPLVGRVVPFVPGIGNDIARPGADEKPYARVPLRPLLSVLELQGRVEGRLGDVTAPVLVLTSRVDHTIDNRDSAEIVRGVTSETAEQVWLERSFHVATLDYDADRIIERTLAFIGATVGTPSTGVPPP